MKPDSREYQYLDAAVPDTDAPPSAVALGVFDGVHVGHQALLRVAQSLAAQTGGVPAALTFDPLPAALFAPLDRVPLLLGTLSDRARLLHEAGAERVWVARFDAAFAELSPDAFVQDVLLEKIHACAVVVGEDFQFGKNRAGNAAFLQDAGQKHGFQVGVVPPVLVDGVPARSTVIRKLISEGQVEAAARLLGRPYVLEGTIAHGRKMGRTLGYPTANLASPPDILVPGAGVYAGRVYIAAKETFGAAISVGTNPTVTPGKDAPRTVEAFLLDGFDRDIYGQSVRVEFAALLRPMVKFDGLDALIQQMGRDVEQAKRILIAGFSPATRSGYPPPRSGKGESV